MALVITFSATNGGLAFSDPLSYGNVANGINTTEQTIFVRHNGVNPITGCGLYIDVADAGTYAGSRTALDDKIELVSWGNGSTSQTFGGYQINLNATGSFSGSSWPTLANKTSVDGFGYAVRTGVGDASTNPIVLPTATGASSAGTIAAGASPNVRFRTRVAIPSSVSVLGVRQFRLKMVYNYTS